MNEPPPSGPSARRARTVRAPFRHASASLALLLGLAFMARWLLSDRNSYWLDELLSVVTYGIRNSSGLEAVTTLADQSVHPPLYQLILFYWMRMAGDGEVATRFLSNLYVTGAALCLYFAVRDTMGRRRALMATLFCSLMFGPFYYAMETRSYAQSLFLSALSSLALFRWLPVIAQAETWRGVLASRNYLLLAAANTALLMTHYYNVFFLASQAVFLLVWVAWRARVVERLAAGRIASRLVSVGLPLMAPLFLLLLLWGPTMVRTYEQRDGQFTAKAGAVANPFVAFFVHSVRPNFPTTWPLALAACAALLGLFYVRRGMAARCAHNLPATRSGAFTWYVLVMAFVPFVFAYALFALSGHERYVPRYFLFTAPALAVLLVFVVEQAVLLVHQLVRGRRVLRHYLTHSVCWTLLAAALLVLPGTYRAATFRKEDWRGIAKLVSDVTRIDRSHRYILYTTSYAGHERFDYYLRSHGAKIRTHDSIQPSHERTGELPFDRDRRLIQKHDFLIITFTHERARAYRKALARIAKSYELHQRILGKDGRGMIIYRIKPLAGISRGGSGSRAAKR